MVNLDYGRSHGHGDLDRMNLGLYAFGVPLSADPGSHYNYNSAAPYGPAIKSFEGPLVANTVIVDGQHQLRGAGQLVKWNIAPDIQEVSAQITGIYPGVAWRRSVALINNITVVVDDLQSDKPHQYESAWHHYGKINPADDCQVTDLKDSLGEGPYQDLLTPRRITGKSVSVDWLYNKVHVRVWQPVEENQLTYTAQTGVCWDNVKGMPVDGLFVRRQASSTRFVTVLEPYLTQRPLKEISVANDNAATKVTLQFTAGGTKQITFDAAYSDVK
jgi:hypothetical protein